MDDKSTILIVDDESVVQQVLKALLAEEGYFISFANNGTEALTQAARITPDLILLDVMLPDMNGFDVCRQLRASPLLAEVPILMLTALGDPGSRLRGIESGADDFITKPFDSIEFLAKVRTISRLNRYRRLLEERIQREHAEQALRESEERYRTISELTSDYAYALRIEADGSVVPEWVTGAFARITGFEPEEAVARGSWDRHVHPDDRPIIHRRTRALLAGRQDVSEFRIVTREGEVRWLRDHAQPMREGPHGRVVRVIGAAQDVTEHRRAQREIAQHRKGLQRLSTQLINAQEAERARLSRELHDELGQALTAVSLNLAEILKGLPPESVPRLGEKLVEARSLTDQALDLVRKIALDLRPGILDDLGLVAALRWHVKRWTRTFGVEVEFRAMNLDQRLDPDVETALYRIVQEALTNVAKHAQAANVRVTLERKPSAVVAHVEDNGRGFVANGLAVRETLEPGAGLLGMRERVSLLGGKLDLWSRPGQGTRLSVEIPLKE